MARRVSAERCTETTIFDVIDEYKARLGKPAPPRTDHRWPPVLIGPTWQTTPDGHWLLPERSIGWWMLGWTGIYLQWGGKPWRFTDEQARFILHWYALNDRFRFEYRTGVLQRLKGWGKDPLGATLCLNEAFGPARPTGDMVDDLPGAMDVEGALVQTAAVAIHQTRNTMRLFPRMISKRMRQEYGIQIGKEMIYGLGDDRCIQAVTSNPGALEGNQTTAALKNETQHWTQSTDGFELDAVLNRNCLKTGGRPLSITNAYEPGTNSVAEQDRDAFELAATGGSYTRGMLYDSIEAPPDAPLSPEAAPEVARAICGDATWLDVEMIVEDILDTRNPPSRSRRFWYNQIWAAEDAWVVPQHWDLLADTTKTVGDLEPIVMFFDGSKSDDSTALVGCRLSDGHLITLGLWQRPPGNRGKDWLAPRETVDHHVRQIMADRKVVAFWADPSHTLDDETEERYWQPIIDGWHRDFKSKFDVKAWAVQGKHSIEWDMTSPMRTNEFTKAAMVFADEVDHCAGIISAREATAKGIDDPSLVKQAAEPITLTWDGDGRLRRHVQAARRAPNKFGVSLAKDHRESQKKIDLAVCAVGARLLRRHVLNTQPVKKRTGKVW